MGSCTGAIVPNYSAFGKRDDSRRHSFKFEKRCQLLVGPDNESFSVVAVRIRNPDCSPVGIHG